VSRPPRRTFALDLGDLSAEVASGQPRRSRPQRGGRGGKPAVEAPIWQPGAGARQVGVEAGVRLAAYVARQRGLSGREAKRLIEAGAVRVNGQIETFASRPVGKGDIVDVFSELAPQEHVYDPRRVLHDGGGLFAYDKPAWLPVTPTDGPKSWSLADILRLAVGEVIPVHRLDADTSGIVLFARVPAVARRLEAMFRDHAVQKTYLAIVRGQPRESGEHRSYLIKVASGKGFERWKSGRGQDAREAITTWKVIERLGTYGSLVQVMPKTGRYHQIRIHFSEMGFPLYGDRLYGDRRDPVQAPRHMLHAWKAVLPHPGGGPALDLVADVPREFRVLSEALRKLR
jgi:RluA family pseudouridine synthase